MMRRAKFNLPKSTKRKLKNSLWGFLIFLMGVLKSGSDVVYYKELPLVGPWVPSALIIIGIVMLLVVWLSPPKEK